MARTYLWVLPVVFLLAGSAGAQQVQVREEMLANGLRLLMVERHDSPTVACGWVARVGSVDEPPGVTGISHLFEHMMFKGTKTIGTRDSAKDAQILAQQDALRAEMEKEYALLRGKLRRGEISGNIYDPDNMTPRLKELKGQLEGLFAAEKEVIVKDELDQIYTAQGASDLDAFTTEDQTAFSITVPANKLELWFWLESDRLANPVFREFYSERDVVREERRMRTESTPTGKFDEEFNAMFWESSPYAHPVVGWPSDVESITRAQAEAYLATYYAPNNLTAVLVGDFDPAKAVELASHYFGRMPRGKTPPPEVITDEVAQLAAKRMLAEADTNPEVDIRFHAVPFGHKDMFAFQLLADLLNRRTGRLYKALVEEKRVAVGEPDASFEPRRYAGFFEVAAEVKDGRAPGEVEAALLAELGTLAKEPVGDHELQKVKNQELADSYRKLQSNTSLLVRLLLYDSEGSWRFINEAPAKLLAVTAADLQRVAKTYLTAENRNVATYLRRSATTPEDTALAEMPTQLREMVKQQLAQIEELTDRAALGQALARLRQMIPQAPPQMKPGIEYLVRKAQERFDSLPATPPPGREGPKTPPAGERPRP